MENCSHCTFRAYPACNEHLVPLNNLLQLNSMPLDSAKLILEREYNLFLESCTGSVVNLLVSNDKKYIYSYSSDRRIRIWNLEDMRQEAVFFEENSKNPSRRLLACSEKLLVSSSYGPNPVSSVIVWNIRERTHITILENAPLHATYIAITSNSKYIAIMMD